MTPYVTVGRSKAAALSHLREMHGQVEPSSPSQWSNDELDAAHRAGHCGGVVTVAHTHEEHRVSWRVSIPDEYGWKPDYVTFIGGRAPQQAQDFADALRTVATMTADSKVRAVKVESRLPEVHATEWTEVSS